jgi:hypothetical protein
MNSLTKRRPHEKQSVVLPVVFLLYFSFGCKQGEEVAEEAVAEVA